MKTGDKIGEYMRVQYLTEDIVKLLEKSNHKRTPRVFLGGLRSDTLMSNLILDLSRSGFGVSCPNLSWDSFKFNAISMPIHFKESVVIDYCLRELMSCDIAFFMANYNYFNKDSVYFKAEIECCINNNIPYFVCNAYQMLEILRIHSLIDYRIHDHA